jgi:hypothetical protein
MHMVDIYCHTTVDRSVHATVSVFIQKNFSGHGFYRQPTVISFTSRKSLKACGAVYFYRRIQLSTACVIFSGDFLRKPPLEIVFLEAVLYENRQ